MGAACCVVRNRNGPAFDGEDAHQGQARRIAANFAKLSVLLGEK
jgi:hypothetical protein